MVVKRCLGAKTNSPRKGRLVLSFSLCFRKLIQSGFLRCHSARLMCKELQDLTLLTLRAGSVLQMGSTRLWRLSCTTSPLCNMMLPATGSPRTWWGCRMCQPPLSRQVQVCSILVIMTRVGILTAGPSDIFQTGTCGVQKCSGKMCVCLSAQPFSSICFPCGTFTQNILIHFFVLLINAFLAHVSMYANLWLRTTWWLETRLMAACQVCP